MSYYIDMEIPISSIERETDPLIHMTDNWESLSYIIEQGFRPSYCTETITNDLKTQEACFPMVSLSNVSSDYAILNQRSYGTLGIILDKKWGEENDFNPVLYLERKSDITNDIISNFEEIKTYDIYNLNMALKGIDRSIKGIMTKQHIKIFAHSKNYDGNLIRKGNLLSEKYPFGMEREWRKIIKKDQIPYFLVTDDMSEKDKFNEKIKEIRINFPLKYLKGIIVETEYEKEQAKKIICKKYNLEILPENIDLIINTTRHRYED
jgi:hypothetical protein